MEYIKLLTPNIVKSFPQETDYIYQPLSDSFPPSLDLKPDVYEVDNQYTIGSCTANAVTSVPEDMLKKTGNSFSLSRLFNYWTSRNLILEQPGIEGSTLRAAIRAAKHFGLCKESIWPYNIPDVNTKPSDLAFSEACNGVIQRYEIIDNKVTDLSLPLYQILNAATIKTTKAVKSALNEGLSVVFSCNLGQSWLSLTGPWEDHKYIFPSLSNPSVGGHAMVVIGYSDVSQKFLIENSWGTGWGDGGFGGMSYSSFSDNLWEAFVIRCFDGIYINDLLQTEWDWVQKLYLGFYGRPADIGGMIYWRNRLIEEGFGNVVEAFMTSPESSNLYNQERLAIANRLTRKEK